MHFWKNYSEYTCQFTTQQPMTVLIISLYTIMRERSSYVVYFIFFFFAVNLRKEHCDVSSSYLGSGRNLIIWGDFREF